MMIKRAAPGFSLTELMVYIAIVGALSAGLFGVWSFLGTAKKRSTQQVLKTVDAQIKEYYQDTGSYPTSLHDLVDAPAGVKNWHGPYFEGGVPNDGWDQPLQYEVTSKNGRPSYDLYSWGANGEATPEEQWFRVDRR